MADLAAQSPLGRAREQMGQVLFESARVTVREAPWTHVLSVRLSRKSPDDASVKAYLGALGLEGARLEPRAWLVCSEQPLASATPGADLRVTDISDRLAWFAIAGPGARDVIAAGCDPHIVPAGAVVRTRFGSLANAVIAHRAGGEYRLAVDVSLAQAMASWLVLAAGGVKY